MFTGSPTFSNPNVVTEAVCGMMLTPNSGPRTSFTVGNLAAGATVSISYAVTAHAALPAGVTQLSNSARADDDGTNGPDPDPANNTATEPTLVAATSDLSVTKSDGGVTATT